MLYACIKETFVLLIALFVHCKYKYKHVLLRKVIMFIECTPKFSMYNTIHIFALGYLLKLYSYNGPKYSILKICFFFLKFFFPVLFLYLSIYIHICVSLFLFTMQIFMFKFDTLKYPVVLLK